MDHTDHCALFDANEFAIDHCHYRCHSYDLTGQTTLATEVSDVEHSNHGLLPLLGEHGDFYFSIQQIEHGVRGASLPKQQSVPWIFQSCDAGAHFRKKKPRIAR